MEINQPSQSVQSVQTTQSTQSVQPSYIEAKNKLLKVSRLEREAKILNTKIDSMQRFLESNSNSIIMMPESDNRRERTEVIAELMDLKDKFRYLLHELELERLTLISEINALPNEEHAYYLKLRYVYGMDYKQIAYQEHYSYVHVRRLVIEATKYYSEYLIIKASK